MTIQTVKMLPGVMIFLLTQGAGHRAQGAGHGEQGTGHRAQGTGHGERGAGHGADEEIGCVNFWLSPGRLMIVSS